MDENVEDIHSQVELMLTKKLGDTGASPQWLLTVHGVGYKLAE